MVRVNILTKISIFITKPNQFTVTAKCVQQFAQKVLQGSQLQTYNFVIFLVFTFYYIESD